MLFPPIRQNPILGEKKISERPFSQKKKFQVALNLI
jgi:hypothetical protein